MEMLFLHPYRSYSPGAPLSSSLVVDIHTHTPSVDYGEESSPATSPSVCWAGPLLDPLNGSVWIGGSGCRECWVGEACSFLLRFTSLALFQLKDNKQADVMVTLRGATIVTAPARQLVQAPGEALVAFVVTYQSWDAGVYTASIDGDCSLGGDGSLVHTLAHLSIRVRKAVRGTIRSLPPPSPCQLGIYARWRVHKNAVRLAPYKCAKGWAGLDSFASSMMDAGVAEIALIGDSHMRGLFYMLQYQGMGKVGRRPGGGRHKETCEH